MKVLVERIVGLLKIEDQWERTEYGVRHAPTKTTFDVLRFWSIQIRSESGTIKITGFNGRKLKIAIQKLVRKKQQELELASVTRIMESLNNPSNYDPVELTRLKNNGYF